MCGLRVLRPAAHVFFRHPAGEPDALGGGGRRVAAGGLSAVCQGHTAPPGTAEWRRCGARDTYVCKVGHRRQGRCFSPYHGRAPLSLVLKRARLNAPVKIISGDTIVFRAGGGRLQCLLEKRAAPWARGAARAAPPPDVPPDRTAPPSTSTRPRPPPAPPPPPPLHLLPRLALEGGHGLPAQLLRGRRHLALRVIPRRLPTRPPVAPHTHIPHRTPRLVRLSPQHTPSPAVRGPALSQCEWLA